MKIYEIHETVANKVVGGGSRKALAERDFEYVDNKSTILPGQVMILEIPFDSGPHDADIQTVCVDQDGKPLPIIHYPATFLDRVRTFPHADNRVQVEIYNSGTKPIELEDIHFRVRLYTSTDP